MNELLKLLNINCSPEAEGKDFIRIYCGVSFEPHGRASETFEIYWLLELSQIPYHWKSLTGWRKGKSDKPISFMGQTFDIVVCQAITFLKELNSK